MFRLFSLNFMFLIGFHTMCLTHGCIDMIKKMMFSLLFESMYSTVVWLIKNLGDYFTHYIIITLAVYVKYQNSFRFGKAIFIPKGQSDIFFFVRILNKHHRFSNFG